MAQLKTSREMFSFLKDFIYIGKCVTVTKEKKNRKRVHDILVMMYNNFILEL